MINGVASMAGDLMHKAGDIVNKVKDNLRWIHPPEAFGKYIGQDVIRGLANGMSENSQVRKSSYDMSTGVITAVEDIFQIRSPSKVMNEIGEIVTQGFAQGIRRYEDDIDLLSKK